MTEDLDLVVTANMLRTAIRVKLASGTTQKAIWLLIAAYSRDGARRGRREVGGVYRLPVEDIPHERRAEFLDVLNALPNGDLRSTAKRAALAA